LGVVREGFKTGNLEAFQFEHARNRLFSLSPEPEKSEFREATHGCANIRGSCLECQPKLEVT
jgi:hypothetical protein